MENVIETLKKYGITKYRFAKDFNLSRPTLDEYILKFENGEQIQKEKYQIIFASLFEKKLSNETFKTNYERYKRMFRRDAVMMLDEIDPENTDLIIEIIDKLKESIDLDNSESCLIQFVHYVVSNYESDDIVKMWVKYFNDLNGLCDNVRFDDREKKYIGYFYRINNAFSSNNIDSLNSNYFNEYLKRKSELKIERSERTQKVKDRVIELITPYLKDIMSSSLDVENDDEIAQKIISKISVEMNK